MNPAMSLSPKAAAQSAGSVIRPAAAPLFCQDEALASHAAVLPAVTALSDLTNISLLPPTPRRAPQTPTFTRARAHNTATRHTPTSPTTMPTTDHNPLSTSLSPTWRSHQSTASPSNSRSADGASTKTVAGFGDSEGESEMATTLDALESRRGELLEYHRCQLADMLVQQRTVEHQQVLCEQLTDLIAEQEAVLHEHAVKSMQSQSTVIAGSSLPSLAQWDDGESMDVSATPLHSTSVYIPAPSDSDDPHTVGDLVTHLLDDGLETLLNDPPVVPLDEFLSMQFQGMHSEDVAPAQRLFPWSIPAAASSSFQSAVFPEQPSPTASVKTRPSPVHALKSPERLTRHSDHSAKESPQAAGSERGVSTVAADPGLVIGEAAAGPNQAVSSVATNPKQVVPGRVTSAAKHATAAAVNDVKLTPPASPIVAPTASSSLGGSVSLSIKDLQPTLTALKDNIGSAPGIREGQLLQLVSNLSGELDQCKQQLRNSLHVQRIQAGALQTLWQEIQDMQACQKQEAAMSASVQQERSALSISDLKSDQVSNLRDLCEQLQTQVEFLEDRVTALSGTVFVAGETRQRLQRLGFGVEPDNGADGMGEAGYAETPGTAESGAGDCDADGSSLAMSGEGSRSTLSAESLSSSDSEGTSSDGSWSEEDVDDDDDGDERSEHDGSASSGHSSQSQHGASPAAKGSGADDHRTASGEWELTLHHWAASDVLLAWSRINVPASTGNEVCVDDSERKQDVSNDGLLGYRLLVNNVPVVPMIPAPASQVLISGLTGSDTDYQLSLLEEHVDGETLLAPPITVGSTPVGHADDSGATSSPHSLSSPRCSSTLLSPSTPRLKIHYKSLSSMGSQAVLATLQQSAGARSACASPLGDTFTVSDRSSPRSQPKEPYGDLSPVSAAVEMPAVQYAWGSPVSGLVAATNDCIGHVPKLTWSSDASDPGVSTVDETSPVVNTVHKTSPRTAAEHAPTTAQSQEAQLQNPQAPLVSDLLEQLKQDMSSFKPSTDLCPEETDPAAQGHACGMAAETRTHATVPGTSGRCSPQSVPVTAMAVQERSVCAPPAASQPATPSPVAGKGSRPPSEPAKKYHPGDRSPQVTAEEDTTGHNLSKQTSRQHTPVTLACSFNLR